MGDDSLITVAQAMELAEERGRTVSRPTVIAWVKKYRLGRKFDAGATTPFYISRNRFEVVMDGVIDRDIRALSKMEEWCEKASQERKKTGKD